VGWAPSSSTMHVSAGGVLAQAAREIGKDTSEIVRA
jgi:hypothetical protein